MTHVFDCDWKAAFLPDSAKKDRVGYLTDFSGLGLSTALAKDLTVLEPFGNALAPTYAPLRSTADHRASVIGVLDSLSWGGGATDPLTFSCYVSSENATQLRALGHATPKNTAIQEFGWYIARYETNKKEWFEETYPKQPLMPAGQLHMTGKDIRLHVADEPVQVAPNIGLRVFNVYFEVVPAPNQTASFLVAGAPGMNTVLPWGMSMH